MAKPYTKYSWARAEADKRGIPWLFTFATWWAVWKQSGKWRKRGKRKGQYVMARFGDKGPYRADNVKIILHSDNVSEAQLGKPKSAEFVRKISRPRSAAHCAAISDGQKRAWARRQGRAL